MATHDESLDDAAVEPKNPLEFARLLRQGEADRIGSMPADPDRRILEEIRADFGLEPEPADAATRPMRVSPERTVPWGRRLRLVFQPMAAVAGVALLFLLTREFLMPAPPASTPPAQGPLVQRMPSASPAPAMPATESSDPREMLALADPAASGGSPARRLGPPGPAMPTVGRQLELAVAARAGGLVESLAVLLTSLVVASDVRPAAASADLPNVVTAIAAGLDEAGVPLPEAVPATVVLKAPRDPAAAFGVWEVELGLDDANAAGAGLLGWRIAIDLGDLDVVAVGDGATPGFTSPPAYDPAALAGGTLVLAAVSPRAISLDAPIVVARLQARRLAAEAAAPMPLADGTLAAVERRAP